MQQRLLTLNLLMLLGMLSTNIWAADFDPDTPITISSDTAELNNKTGIAHHSGNVDLDQADRHISADELDIYRDANGSISKIVAVGTPAKYRLNNTDQNLQLQANANEIIYSPTDSKLSLTGKAQLFRGQDSFSGPSIIYNLATQSMQAHASDNGRTTLVIHPQKKMVETNE